MNKSKTLPDLASLEAARLDADHELFARRVSVERLIERARTERANLIAAIAMRFTARLRASFRSLRGRWSNPGSVAMARRAAHEAAPGR
jgi:hypothetical protein